MTDYYITQVTSFKWGLLKQLVLANLSPSVNKTLLDWKGGKGGGGRGGREGGRERKNCILLLNYTHTT